MPSRDSDGIVAAFRRHFSVVEILMIESDLAKRHVAEVQGVMSITVEAEDEAIFSLLASLPVENFLRAAADQVGTRYVRIQTESE